MTSKHLLLSSLAACCLVGSSCLLGAPDFEKINPAVFRMGSATGIQSISVSPDGIYQVVAGDPAWILKGKLPGPAADIAVGKGVDGIGLSQNISFTYTDGNTPVHAVIRLYNDTGVASFAQTYAKATDATPSPFPDFTTVPRDLIHFSYGGGFAGPRFVLDHNSGPWLLFDARDHALILSPASHFLAAWMIGDGKTEVASGFNANLKSIPAGATQQSLLVIGTGINRTWDTWGRALTALREKKNPPNDADVFLKYYGYWTDNGAAYWYNYDPAKGYQGTLEAVVDDYRAKAIPLHYVQLDSWWYHKTLTGPGGKLEQPKNSKLPEGDWNRYGGTIEYKAHPFIFPNGMEAFHEKAGLPFMTHNRWIDPASPYHQRYRISGIAAVDRGFWNEIASYLKASGVVGYEQDWLDAIFKYSPELSSTIDTGDQFLDNMAAAFKEHGLTMQYCMALPGMFMQGIKYGNLTFIRCSGDRFSPNKYHAFLYASRLAFSMGIWPWSDVFRSPETNNVLLSNLSAGPVGTGDALGEENKDNILKAIRMDGVIVKPDVPLLPTDASYIAEGKKEDSPLVAATYTDHGGIKTVYGVAIKRSEAESDAISIPPSDLGIDGPVYLYDYFARTGVRLNKGDSLPVQFHGQDLAYFIAAPAGPGGIAFLGDEGLFIGTGKKRVPSMKIDGETVAVELLLAANEARITLHGYAPKLPRVSVRGGDAGPVNFDAATGYFTVMVNVDTAAPAENIEGDATRTLFVKLGL